MDEPQALQLQLEEARDEAELNLLQLQQVQEELEHYFLRCQELERQPPAAAPAADPAALQAAEAECRRLKQALAQSEAQLASLQTLGDQAQELQEARDEAELNLLQLQQVQEELEHYFLRCQELERLLADRDTEQNKAAAVSAALETDCRKLKEQLEQERKKHRREQQASARRCEQLERDLEAVRAAAPAPDTLDALQTELEAARARLAAQEIQRREEKELLGTAQRMLEGQARYLDDVSRREEEAAQAMDRERQLEAEIRYYLQHSRPTGGLDPQRISRVIQLAKQPQPQPA
jgi:DNA repair exonuclease SbcCD ATPase subunit